MVSSLRRLATNLYEGVLNAVINDIMSIHSVLLPANADIAWSTMPVPSASSSFIVQLVLDPDIVMMPYTCVVTRSGCASSVSDVKHPGRNVVNEFAKSTMWVHHARCTGHANAAPPRRATSARPAMLQIGFVCRRARPSGVNLHKPFAITSYGTACRLPRPRVQPSSQFFADIRSKSFGDATHARCWSQWSLLSSTW